MEFKIPAKFWRKTKTYNEIITIIILLVKLLNKKKLQQQNVFKFFRKANCHVFTNIIYNHFY